MIKTPAPPKERPKRRVLSDLKKRHAPKGISLFLSCMYVHACEIGRHGADEKKYPFEGGLFTYSSPLLKHVHDRLTAASTVSATGAQELAVSTGASCAVLPVLARAALDVRALTAGRSAQLHLRRNFPSRNLSRPLHIFFSIVTRRRHRLIASVKQGHTHFAFVVDLADVGRRPHQRAHVRCVARKLTLRASGGSECR
jgi:hypothetical protein